jgi:hypothetical protein
MKPTAFTSETSSLGMGRNKKCCKKFEEKGKSACSDCPIMQESKKSKISKKDKKKGQKKTKKEKKDKKKKKKGSKNRHL